MRALRLVPFLFLSCSSAPPLSVAGAWSGSWASSITQSSMGNVSINVAQTGGATTGSGSISLYGSVTLDGTYSASNGKWIGTVRNGLATAKFDLDVHGNSASGTYNVPITADIGTVSLSRTTR